MSEHEKLINEARRWPRAQGVEPSRPPVEVINDLADALAASVESKQNGAKSSQEFCFDEDALLALIPVPQVSTYVKDWPKDEQEMFRDPKWFSFTMRGEALDLYRRQKIVKQIIALIRGA